MVERTSLVCWVPVHLKALRSEFSVDGAITGVPLDSVLTGVPLNWSNVLGGSFAAVVDFQGFGFFEPLLGTGSADLPLIFDSHLYSGTVTRIDAGHVQLDIDTFWMLAFGLDILLLALRCRPSTGLDSPWP